MYYKCTLVSLTAGYLKQAPSDVEQASNTYIANAGKYSKNILMYDKILNTVDE